MKTLFFTHHFIFIIHLIFNESYLLILHLSFSGTIFNTNYNTISHEIIIIFLICRRRSWFRLLLSLLFSCFLLSLFLLLFGVQGHCTTKQIVLRNLLINYFGKICLLIGFGLLLSSLFLFGNSLLLLFSFVFHHFQLLFQIVEVLPLEATIQIKSELLHEGNDWIFINGLLFRNSFTQFVSNLFGKLHEILFSLEDFSSSNTEQFSIDITSFNFTRKILRGNALILGSFFPNSFFNFFWLLFLLLRLFLRLLYNCVFGFLENLLSGILPVIKCAFFVWHCGYLYTNYNLYFITNLVQWLKV